MTKKWLETRKSYLKKLKSQVGLILGQTDPSILEYAEDNKNLYEKIWSRSNEEEFFERASQVEYILLGDFHSSFSVKRFYIKLLKELKKRSSKKLYLALECFERRHQADLNLWLKGALKEEIFLERVNWEENWGFSWESYKKFISVLKKEGFEFFAANYDNLNFKERDQRLAENLQGAFEEYQDENPLILFLVGQHHIGPNHLKKHLSSSKEILSVHLDPEEIYFALGDYGLLDEIHVLSLQDHFCFLHSPPWVHWQSHLLYLDEYLEEGEEDIEFYEEDRQPDYDEVVYEYVKLMCKDLGIEQNIKPLEVEFIDEYQVEGEPLTELYKSLQPLLDSETSFYWPEQYEGIMVVNSLNHAATVAGRYLHTRFMGVSTLPWCDLNSFEEWAWLETVGYFLSKFINPKRKPAHMKNLSAFLKARLGEQSAKKILKFLIGVEVHKAADLSVLSPLSWSELVYAARLFGDLVGEALFEQHLEGKLPLPTLKNYMAVPITDPECFKPFYKLVLDKTLKTF